jgi:hypothetical protein
MFNQYKKAMINFIVLVLLVLPTFTHSANIYDNSINNLVFERSTFYYKNQGGDYNFFLEQVPTDKKIFVHLHGCGGVGRSGQHILKTEYMEVGGAVIFIDFLKRSGVESSCPNGKYGNTSEISNNDRLTIRRKEAEVLVADLQLKGYTDIYISGHSEGGRVASTWTIPVKGVIIHGMDCKLGQFWNIQRNQKTLVMFSWKDDWLNAQRSVASCQHIFNKGWVTEINSNDVTHAPFYYNKVYIEAFQKWLLN